MPVQITCQNCGKSIRASEKYAGKRVKCPSCKASLHIPLPDDRQAVTDIPQKADAESGNKPLPVKPTEEKEPNQPAEDVPENGKAAKPEPAHIYPAKSGKKRKLILATALAALAAVLVLYFIVKNPAEIQFADKTLAEAEPESPDQQITLAQIVLNDSKAHSVRREALEKLTDQEALAQVVLNVSAQDIRLSALKKLEDQDALALIARNAPDEKVRIAAVKKLTDHYVLGEIFAHTSDEKVRMIAEEKLFRRDQNPSADIAKLENQNALAQIVLNYTKVDSVRREALEKLTDQEALAQVVLNASGQNIRRSALRKLTDQKTLAKIALNDPHIYICEAAVKKLTDQDALAQVAINNTFLHVCYIAVKKLTDQKALAQVALNASDTDVREVAVKKLTDQKALAQAALNDSDTDVREVAVEKLTDQKILAQIALNESEILVRKAAIRKLTDQETLTRIALNDSNKFVRETAVEKLKDQKTLTQIALNDSDARIRDIAGTKLPDQSQMIKETTDQNLLLDIAQNNLNPWNRKAAVEELSDQKILAQAALNASDKYIRKIAVIKLSNQEALAQVVLNASDQDTRLSAVKKLTDQKILARIAEKHSDAIIRNLAGKKLPDQIQMIQKVTDQNLLLDIAQNNLNPRNRKAAVEKLTDQDALAKIALNDSYSDVRLSATEKLTDQNILAKVALNDSGRYVRQLAAEKLTDQKTLAQIALNDSEQIVRKAAIEKLTDQKELAQIALNASDRNVRYQAVEKLTDQKTLAQIALNDSDLIFRRTAAKKLTDQKTLAQIVLNDPYLDDITIEKLTDQKLLTQIALNQSFPYRRSVIEKLTDQDALAQIALNDPDEMNRLIARGKLTDQKILAETAMDAHDMSVRVEAAEKLTDQKAMGQFIIKELNSYFQHLPKHIYEGEGCFPYTNVGQVWDKVHDQQVWGEIASIDTTCREFYTRVISKLTDQNLLAELVLRLTDPFPINEAMEKLTDQEALAKVASNHANIIFRRRAAEKLTDQKILGEFALKASDVMIRRNAVEKLTDPKVLIKVVQNDTDAAIRETAITFLNNKINELEKQIRGLTEQDSYEDVFPAIEMLAELIENTPPVTDDQLSENLDILEHIYKGIRKYPDADPLLKKTLTVLEKIKPLDELIPDLRDMGLFYVASGEFEKAGGFFSRALEIDNMLIDRILGTASEDKKISFISSKKDGLHFFLSLVSQHLKENPAAKKEAFNAWLRRKGVILEANKLFQDPLLYADNPRAEKVFQELSEVRKQLSDLVFTKKDADYSETLSELEEKKQKLETDLSRISQPFALKQRIERAYCEKVAWVLNENSVLLEFATIRAYNFKAAEEPQWEPDRYLVFVLHAGKCDTLALIDLGDAETIDNAVANYKKLVTMQSTGMRMEVSAEKVYNLIFAPLKKELGDAKEIFISPDSDLSLIPFEMIQDPDGKFLIEDYTFSYLAAGRDIMGFDQIQEKGGKSVIIGDPDFETAGGKFSAINKLTANQEHVFTRSPDMTNFNFGRLPETKKEAEIIYSLIGKENSELYTDKHATEKVLFQKNAPKLLHLATHGFFLSNIDIEETQSSEFYHKNPLLRSGIALAGANAALKSENPADSDGIVTAEKILGLKLRGTDTVVLSACDTGMGDVRAGEGIYGLRRAFTQAGTKSLIMSMWPVPDKESRELMTEFYKNILSGKMKRNEALRQAVLKQKETVNQRYGYPSPLFWGAFVFMGEP